jgi:protocatechuate 3,4-dioxygenase beta subunit
MNRRPTMRNAHRRLFIKVGLFGGMGITLSRLAHAAGHLLNPTPQETEGPFYPVLPQKDKDFDLTHIEGKSGVAKGKVIIVVGRVLDTHGNPIEDATVDLWQANAAGRYRHPRDRNTAPLDPNFQGWAIVPSGKQGGFRFKTVFPGAYPAGVFWTRPPHIHFKVSKPGYISLTTQMYFPGQPLNESDLLLRDKSSAERKLMIAERVEGATETYRFNIILGTGYMD